MRWKCAALILLAAPARPQILVAICARKDWNLRESSTIFDVRNKRKTR